MDVAKRIRELREAKGFTQADMARKLDIAVLNYGKIERGVTELTVTRLEQIAKLLNIRVVDLFTDLDTDSKQLIYNLQEELKIANRQWAYYISKYNENDDLADYCFELFSKWFYSDSGVHLSHIHEEDEEGVKEALEKLKDPNTRKILFALLSFGLRSVHSSFFAGLIWKLAPFKPEEKYLLRNFMKNHFNIDNDELELEESEELVKAKILIRMKGLEGNI